MYDDHFELKLFGGIGLVVVIILALLVGMFTISSRKYCQSLTKLAPTYALHWDFWTGCIVQTPNGYWVDATEYQYVEGDLIYTGGE
jgi:hypothetical protein